MQNPEITKINEVPTTFPINIYMYIYLKINKNSKIFFNMADSVLF